MRIFLLPTRVGRGKTGIFWVKTRYSGVVMRVCGLTYCIYWAKKRVYWLPTRVGSQLIRVGSQKMRTVRFRIYVPSSIRSICQ